MCESNFSFYNNNKQQPFRTSVRFDAGKPREKEPPLRRLSCADNFTHQSLLFALILLMRQLLVGTVECASRKVPMLLPENTKCDLFPSNAFEALQIIFMFHHILLEILRSFCCCSWEKTPINLTSPTGISCLKIQRQIGNNPEKGILSIKLSSLLRSLTSYQFQMDVLSP